MHIERPNLTTTSYKKRKDKVTKSAQAEIEAGWRERNVRLREMGLPKETLEQYTEWVHGRGKKTKEKKNTKAVSKAAFPQKCLGSGNMAGSLLQSNIPERDNSISKLWDNDPGACAKKPSPVYTGTKMIGIGTMHKSNMVPIFSDDEAKDISRMRR
jgi:hypothetical protein